MNQQEPQDKKELYERKKQERQERRQKESSSAQRKNSARTFVKYGVWTLVILALGYGVFLLVQTQAPEGEDLSRSIPDIGREHVAVGGEQEYNSNPPTSGPHYNDSARSGCREEALADGHLVHSLEHGMVWISYQPTVGQNIKDLLCNIGDDPSVVITPREENETDVALAAWGRLDTFDLENGEMTKELQQRVRDFILRYKNKGPERIPPTAHSTGI